MPAFTISNPFKRRATGGHDFALIVAADGRAIYEIGNAQYANPTTDFDDGTQFAIVGAPDYSNAPLHGPQQSVAGDATTFDVVGGDVPWGGFRTVTLG